MADDAFALSPISARAELPSERDYDAIREAFMETARGRWFLGEYGKRNRNADTSMVLDAVARIESTIAAHRQAPLSELPDALVLIRGLLSDAKDTAARTMSGPDAEEALAALNKATRIIREIAWTLREYGTDARICDMLDAQVNAIDASHQHTIAVNKRDAVLATFDLLIRRIGELGGSGAATPSSDSETASSSPSVTDSEPPAATSEPAEAMTPTFETAAEAVAEAALEVAAMPAATTQDIPAPDTPEVPSPLSETSVAEMTASAAEAEVAAALMPDGGYQNQFHRIRDRTGHGRAGRDRAGNGRAGNRRFQPCRAAAGRRTGHDRARDRRGRYCRTGYCRTGYCRTRYCGTGAGDGHRAGACARTGNASPAIARRDADRKRNCVSFERRA
jgi:hypothetical protein